MDVLRSGEKWPGPSIAYEVGWKPKSRASDDRELTMELAGLEPPTSWVRSRDAGQGGVAKAPCLQTFCERPSTAPNPHMRGD
jgi:hypothetical protein